MANRPRFNLKNKNEKSTLIVLIYRVKGKRIVYSTGMTISPKNWNDKSMRARATADFFDSQVINENLNRLEEHVKAIDREFRAKGEIPTVEEFKEAMRKSINGGQEASKSSFSAFVEAFIRERSAMPNYSPASIKVYKTARNHYFKYTRGKAVEFKDVTLDHLADFVTYLRKKGFGDNYVHKLLATLRAMLNDAQKRDIGKHTPFSIGSFKVTKRDSDTVYMNMEELTRLEHLDLSGNPKLARVRDLFLLGSFTGLRFSDFTKITPDHIKSVDGVEILSIAVTKTQDLVEIPFHPVVKKILVRNDGQPPQPISNQKMNTYLKELCQLLDMNELVTKREFPGGKMKVLQIPKWQLVSSHTARRSFATNAYKAGIDAISIMKITGQKQHSTFMKYIRVSKEENAVRVGRHAFFQ